MKRHIFTLIILAMAANFSAALEFEKFSFGAGAELNGNTPEGMAFGPALAVEYALEDKISVGFRTILSYAKQPKIIDPDESSVNTAEIQLFVRSYIKNFALFKEADSRFFVQADAGLAFMETQWNTKKNFAGGMTAGARIALPIKDFYMEPYIRDGYPLILGGGIMFVWSPSKTEPIVKEPEKKNVKQPAQRRKTDPEPKSVKPAEQKNVQQPSQRRKTEPEPKSIKDSKPKDTPKPIQRRKGAR